MVDLRIRHLNPNGQIPAPGGRSQLLEELKAAALIIQKEMLPEARSGSFEDFTMAPVWLKIGRILQSNSPYIVIH